MPLRSLTPAVRPDPPPADVARFLREADRRVARFQEATVIPGFVPSDYAGAYRVLRALADSPDLRGRRFCEWGSGFGVVTCLAAALEFDACGIEVEWELVEEARRLAEDFDLTAEFVCGSFVPPGAEGRVHAAGQYAWFTTEADDAYAELGLDPDDMDVVFAYPWPDEEGVTDELFERYAGVGAVLVTFRGGGEFRVRRKTARRR
jgi:hypothetical protein